MDLVWREANESDVGRLARFRDRKGDDWTFGLLDGIDAQECVYECVATEGDPAEPFQFCEVQDTRLIKQPTVLRDPTSSQLGSACLSYRHDYGLMSQLEKAKLEAIAIDWLRAWQKEGMV